MLFNFLKCRRLHRSCISVSPNLRPPRLEDQAHVPSAADSTRSRTYFLWRRLDYLVPSWPPAAPLCLIPSTSATLPKNGMNFKSFRREWGALCEKSRQIVHSFLTVSCQFSSVAQSCLTLCHPMDCSMPGLAVHHQFPELAQTPVHRVGDAIQPSHPLSSPSPPAFNLSQHQGLFQWVSSSHQVTKVVELQLQHQSFQWISGLISFRID